MHYLFQSRYSKFRFGWREKSKHDEDSSVQEGYLFEDLKFIEHLEGWNQHVNLLQDCIREKIVEPGWADYRFRTEFSQKFFLAWSLSLYIEWIIIVYWEEAFYRSDHDNKYHLFFFEQLKAYYWPAKIRSIIQYDALLCI